MQTLNDVLANTPLSAESMIARALTDPMHVDELAAKLALPIERITAALTVMELNGTLRQVGTQYELIPAPEEPRHLPAFDVGGVMLPHAAQEDIQVAKRQGQRYVIVGPEHGALGACPNCLGMENIMLRFIKGGPYQNAPATRRPETSTWLGDGWYRVESRYYPCPACGDPRTRHRVLVWQKRTGARRARLAGRLHRRHGLQNSGAG